MRKVVDPDADLDFAVLGVLDRVGEQVAKHLPQAQRVADHDRGHAWFDLAAQLDLLGFGASGEKLRGLLDEVADLERLAHEVHLARFDLRVVEDVVDDLHHRAGCLAHRVDEASLALVERRACEQLGHAEHAIHRRADLVAHVGQELVLRPHHGFRLEQAHLDVAGALQDLLARREANVAHVALVGGEPVGKRVEIIRESGQLVTGPPGLRPNLFLLALEAAWLARAARAARPPGG